MRFHVEVNGVTKCIAGVDGPGLMQLSMMYQHEIAMNFHRRVDKRDTLEEFCSPRISIGVTGGPIGEKPDDDHTYITWLRDKLNIGDEIRIRIIETGESTDPINTISFKHVSIWNRLGAKINVLFKKKV